MAVYSKFYFWLCAHKTDCWS